MEHADEAHAGEEHAGETARDLWSLFIPLVIYAAVCFVIIGYACMQLKEYIAQVLYHRRSVKSECESTQHWTRIEYIFLVFYENFLAARFGSSAIDIPPQMKLVNAKSLP